MLRLGPGLSVDYKSIGASESVHVGPWAHLACMQKFFRFTLVHCGSNPSGRSSITREPGQEDVSKS